MADRWPEFGADARNSRHRPDAAIPTDVRPRWSLTGHAAGVADEDASSPAVADVPVDGDVVTTVVVGRPDGSVLAVDLADGSERWRFRTPIEVTSSPAIAAVPTGDAGAGAAAAASDAGGRDGVAPDESGESTVPTAFVGACDDTDGEVSHGTIHALDARDGRERWRHETREATIHASPTVVGTTVLVGGRRLRALDARDGRERWSFPAPVHDCSPAVHDGTVVVGSYDGHVYGLTPDGEERWRFEADERVRASPAIATGADADGRSTPTVVVGTWGGTVYGLTLDGRERWRFRADNAVWSSAAVAGGTAYVGSWDGRVYALSIADGRERWRFETDATVVSSPAVAGDAVVVGSWDGRVYALTLDGRERWRFETGGAVDTSPAVADGAVVVATHDALYALAAADRG